MDSNRKRRFCVETYVVRVYRHQDEDGKEILGRVEIVGVSEQKTFTTMSELCDIISAHPKPAKGPGQRARHRSVQD